MLGILKFKVHLPLHQNFSFDLHSVKTDRQLIVSLSFPVLGVAPNKVEFSKQCHCGRKIKHTATQPPLRKNVKASGQIDNVTF
jgi:hypothetical protein